MTESTNTTPAQAIANANSAPAPEKTEAAPEAAEQPKQETAAQKERRLLKAKVNGREVEVDEETLLKHYSRGAGADEKLREAAQIRKHAESFFEQFQNDPESVLDNPKLSIDKQKLAQKWLKEAIEAELMENDPEAKHMSDVERRLKEYEDREKKQKEEEQKSQYQKVVESRREAIASKLTAALEMSPLSKNPDIQAEVVTEMAKYMRICKQAGHDVSPEELAEHVHNTRLASYHALAQDIDGDDLIGWLGEAVVNKIRKADLARLRKSREVESPQVAQEWSRNDKRESKPKISSNELRRMLNK